MRNFTGLTYLNKHSFKDYGITMAHNRTIGIPDKKKYTQTLPFSNVVYDYSSIFGSQSYEERTLKYSFNVVGEAITTKVHMNMVKTQLINWFMSSEGKAPLYDDNYPGFHFMAEVEGRSSFREDWNFGILEVEFTAYPFMISNRPEGHDIWDEFNFLLDVSQPLKFELPTSSYEYVPLTVGSSATIAAWATTTVGGTNGNLAGDVGITRRVLEVINSGSSSSTRSYMLQDFPDPILEQDILQAGTNFIDVEVINAGTPSVIPELRLVDKGGQTPKLSILNSKDGKVYNVLGARPNNTWFMLKSGVNKLRIYSHRAHSIEFIFTKELI